MRFIIAYLKRKVEFRIRLRSVKICQSEDEEEIEQM